MSRKKKLPIYEFRDKDGKQIFLPGSTTIPQMVAMGIRFVGLCSPNEPLKKGIYRNVP